MLCVSIQARTARSNLFITSDERFLEVRVRLQIACHAARCGQRVACTVVLEVKIRCTGCCWTL
eukprot:1382411-Amphidinium_carterae.1